MSLFTEEEINDVVAYFAERYHMFNLVSMITFLPRINSLAQVRDKAMIGDYNGVRDD